MKIAIFGIQGQLGNDLATAFPSHEIAPMTIERVDITDAALTERELKSESPDWVINAAAMTHVDRCETETAPAFQINGTGARNVARACAATGAPLVHVSTDYVFDGTKGAPYVEGDTANPLNVYGMSKLAGEIFVRNECPQHFIVRTSGLYGLGECWGKGTNFVKTMLRLAGERSTLKVVNDERLTPTYATDLATQLRTLIESPPAHGTYHATNAGECSWFEFAVEIFRLAQANVTVEGITVAEWGSATRRPGNSVLDNAGLRSAGIDVMPDWRDALARYMADRESAPAA